MQISAIAGAVLPLLLAGCAKTASVAGKPIPADLVAQIVPGETTEAELWEWFGRPADVVATNEGKVLTYQYRKEASRLLSMPFLGIGGGVASGQILIVTLDPQGRVIRHTFIGGP